MFVVSVQNEQGEILPLKPSTEYQVIGISGLNPPKAEVNTSVIATSDGSLFNSSRLTERNIVITLDILPPIEKNRINLYRYFRSKRWVKFFFRNDSRNICIEGYVEDMPVDLFAPHQLAQISIICPQPFFRAIDEVIVEFSALENLFEFPFSIGVSGIPFSELSAISEQVINNAGDVTTGIILELRAVGIVQNPKIFNTETREFFGVNYSMRSGDLITINTNVGEKSVSLLRDGDDINLMNYIAANSTWLQLAVGDNILTYSADLGLEYLSFRLVEVINYEGV